MSKTGWIIVVVLIVVAAGGWASRGKAVDFGADEVIAKFQGASCEQLKAARSSVSLRSFSMRRCASPSSTRSPRPC